MGLGVEGDGRGVVGVAVVVSKRFGGLRLWSGLRTGWSLCVVDGRVEGLR